MSEEDDATAGHSEILVVGCSRVGKALLVRAAVAYKHQNDPIRSVLISSPSTPAASSIQPSAQASVPLPAVYRTDPGFEVVVDSAAAPSIPSDSTTHNRVPWRIRTKYYTADVNFRIHTLPSTNSAPPPSLSSACPSAPEALVLVFDASQEATFQAVREWAQHEQQEPIVEQAEIRLVVSTNIDAVLLASLSATTATPTSHQPSPTNHTNGTTDPFYPSGPPLSDDQAALSSQKSITINDTSIVQSSHTENAASSQEQCQQAVTCIRPSWHDAVADWCVSHGWEYVETCAAMPDLDRQLQVEGDRHGVGRVVEALSAHMWPGLVEVGEVERSQQQQSMASTNDKSELHQQLELEGRLEYEPPQLLDCDLDQALLNLAAAAAGDGNVQQADAAVSSQDLVVGSVSSKQSANSEGTVTGAAEDGEKHVDDFEKLMGEMQGLRSISSQVSDAERRRSAAALAMRFAAMLGAGGSDDDEEGGSSANCDSDSY